MTLPRAFDPLRVVRVYCYPLPSSSQAPPSLAVRQQPLPQAYVGHYAARAAACRRHHHIGSHQGLPNTNNEISWCPFWSPFTTRGSIRRWIYSIPPHPRGGPCPTTNRTLLFSDSYSISPMLYRLKQNKIIVASAYFGPMGGSHFEDYAFPYSSNNNNNNNK
jgi:hypothetical protein